MKVREKFQHLQITNRYESLWKALISRAFLGITTIVIIFGSFIILKRIEINDRDVNMDISVKIVMVPNGLVRI